MPVCEEEKKRYLKENLPSVQRGRSSRQEQPALLKLLTTMGSADTADPTKQCQLT